jgi:hypothetical protein
MFVMRYLFPILIILIVVGLITVNVDGALNVNVNSNAGNVNLFHSGGPYQNATTISSIGENTHLVFNNSDFFVNVSNYQLS